MRQIVALGFSAALFCLGKPPPDPSRAFIQQLDPTPQSAYHLCALEISTIGKPANSSLPVGIFPIFTHPRKTPLQEIRVFGTGSQKQLVAYGLDAQFPNAVIRVDAAGEKQFTMPDSVTAFNVFSSTELMVALSSTKIVIVDSETGKIITELASDHQLGFSANSIRFVQRISNDLYAATSSDSIVIADFSETGYDTTSFYNWNFLANGMWVGGITSLRVPASKIKIVEMFFSRRRHQYAAAWAHLVVDEQPGPAHFAASLMLQHNAPITGTNPIHVAPYFRLLDIGLRSTLDAALQGNFVNIETNGTITTLESNIFSGSNLTAAGFPRQSLWPDDFVHIEIPRRYDPLQFSSTWVPSTTNVLRGVVGAILTLPDEEDAAAVESSQPDPHHPKTEADFRELFVLGVRYMDLPALGDSLTVAYLAQLVNRIQSAFQYEIVAHIRRIPDAELRKLGLYFSNGLGALEGHKNNLISPTTVYELLARYAEK